MKLVLFISVLIYLFDSVLYTANAECMVWSHLSGLGGDNRGTNRTCATRSGGVFVAEECEPNDHLCEVEETITTFENCTAFPALPWKANLPPGDDCGGHSTCFPGTTCNIIEEQPRCVGIEKNLACSNDMQCQPGLFCWHTGTGRNNTCQPILHEGESCDQHKRCEFGTQCSNLTCTRFGTLDDGTKFTVYDDELYPTAANIDIPAIYRLCKNFWAFDTKARVTGNRVVYECSGGPKKNFTDYETTDAGFRCNYTVTNSNGTIVRNITETPKCGFNTESKYYCPMRRGPDNFEVENSWDRGTWKLTEDFTNSTCHHRSSIQYCIIIQNNFLYQQRFNSAIRNEFRTTGDNYPMIATNDKRVGNAIRKTRNWWRMVDSSFTANLNWFTAILGLMATALYL